MQNSEATAGYTRYWCWACPTDEPGHARLDTTEDGPSPICSCGEPMVDGAIFTDRSKIPPFRSSGGWVWNEARGAAGHWERFDPEKTVLVSLADMLALRDALAPHLTEADHGIVVIRGAISFLRRAKPDQRVREVAGGTLVSDRGGFTGFSPSVDQ